MSQTRATQMKKPDLDKNSEENTQVVTIEFPFTIEREFRKIMVEWGGGKRTKLLRQFFPHCRRKNLVTSQVVYVAPQK